MTDGTESESRKLLRRLRNAMAGDSAGQARLDEITHLIADSMGTEVCSVYLFRDAETLELCATEGLKPEAVHQTRMRMGEGLVGRVAKVGTVVNEADAPSAKGFGLSKSSPSSSRSSIGFDSSASWISCCRSRVDRWSRRMACCSCGVIVSCWPIFRTSDGFIADLICRRLCAIHCRAP